MELILVSWQSAHRWLCHKPGGRLPLLSTMYAACPRPLRSRSWRVIFIHRRVHCLMLCL